MSTPFSARMPEGLHVWVWAGGARNVTTAEVAQRYRALYGTPPGEWDEPTSEEIAEYHASAPWNPRYLAYCRERGYPPDLMWGVDAQASPGGPGQIYMQWIGERWREWGKATGHRNPHSHSEADHAAFDAWLATR